MTIQSNQGFGVTIFGATSSSGGGGGGTPGGSNGQVQYNSSGSFAGAAGLITDGASLTVTSGSFGLSGNISAPAWTTAGIRYKNVAATITDTSSTGTVAAAYTDLFGGNTIAASNATTFTDYYTMFVSAATAGSNVTMTNKWALGLAGNLKLGPDASGTNQAGTNVTIGGSRGTGTGAGGSIVFQVAPAGTTGTAQNALATALTIDSAKLATFSAGIKITDSQAGGFGIYFSKAAAFYIGGADNQPTIFTTDTNENGTFALVSSSGRRAILRSDAAFAWSSSSSNLPGSLAGDLFLTRAAAGVLKINGASSAGGSVQYSAYTFATLPTGAAGMVAYISDASNTGTINFGDSVTAGSGSTKLLCWYNGTNWTVIGK